MKKIAILQPGYIPWLGFFDLIYRSDTFIILDDVQYTVRDWRSRNRIKTSNGITWLTVPVRAKGVRNKQINEVETDNSQCWQKAHLKTIEYAYKKAPYFNEIMSLYNNVLENNFIFLIDIDMDIIRKFCDYLDLHRNIMMSSHIPSTGKKDLKLLSICKHSGATRYISGNAAKDYLREDIFAREQIEIEWHNYRHPYYNQLWIKEQGFISHLSILDLLFNHGPDSLNILTGSKIIRKPGNIKHRRADEIK